MNKDGNPKIKEIAKKESTGPNTAAGKVRSSLNNLKVIKSEDVAQMPWIKPDYIDRYNSFVLFIKSLTGKAVNEILELENISELIKNDLAVRVVQKMEKGIPLQEADYKVLKLLKETNESLHKLKYGTKQTNLNVKLKYSDIRDQMFKEPEAKNVTEEAKKHGK